MPLLAIIALTLLALGLPAGVAPAAAAPRPRAASSAAAPRPAAQIAPASLTIAPTTLPSGQLGLPYQQVIGASGGVAPYSFALTAGEMPPGLALNASGVLSGLPTAVGQYGLIVTATDAQGATASQFLGVLISSPIALSPPALPEGTVGSVYRQIFAASGGTSPYTFTVTAGALPPGLALSAAGLLSGTASAPGFYSFGVDATDARGLVGSRSYGLLIVSAFSIVPSALPSGEVGASYSQALSGSGGVAPYSLAVTDGTLPPGLALSPDGLLSGTPTTSSLYDVTITATDARGLSSRRFYSIVITQVPLTVGPGSLPDGRVAAAYRQTLTASGGTKPYTFAVIDGALPPGLTLGRDGRISGAPTAEGFFFFTVRATDARSRTGLAFYSILITQTPLIISPANLPNGTVGTAYRQDVTVTGGAKPYSLAVQGSLPPGLTLRSDGRLLGRPTAAGEYFFGIGVTDARGRVGGQFYSLRIAQSFVLSPPFLPNGMAGTPYQQAVSATGGRAPYTFALGDGALPPGLTLSPAGAIAGRPTAPGFYGFTISAIDSRGVVDTHAYALTILTPIAVSPPALLEGRVGTIYQQALGASGGGAPYTFAVTAGALPPGLALSPEGLLTGTPAGEGFYSFTVGATDARGISGGESYSLIIQQALEISPLSLAAAAVGLPYRASLLASAGVAPYTFVITDGILPDGLSLSADGLLSGVPTTAGFVSFTALATDARGQTGRRQYFLVTTEAQIAVGPDVLPDGQVGADYQQQLTGSGGAAPYTFIASSLAPGLLLSADGLLRGVPVSPGQFFISIEVFDAGGSAANRSYTISVAPIEITPAPGQLPAPLLHVPYRQVLIASGGVGPYTFLNQSGPLPPGLTLSRGGEISGTASIQGNFFLNIAVVDSRGFVGQQFYFFPVVLPLALSADPLPDAAAGVPYRAAPGISGGAPPYGLTVVSGALPPGLFLTEIATIEGIPAISGVYTFTLDVGDNSGQGASRTYTIVVN